MPAWPLLPPAQSSTPAIGATAAAISTCPRPQNTPTNTQCSSGWHAPTEAQTHLPWRAQCWSMAAHRFRRHRRKNCRCTPPAGRRHPRHHHRSSRSQPLPPGRPCRPRTATAAAASGTSPASPTEGAGPGLPRASCSLFCPRKHAAAGVAQTPQTTAKPTQAQPPCPHRSRPPQPAPAGQRGRSNTHTGPDAAVASSGPSRPTQPARAADTCAAAAGAPADPAAGRASGGGGRPGPPRQPPCPPDLPPVSGWWPRSR